VKDRLAAQLEAIAHAMAWVGIATIGLLPFPIAYDAVARAFGRPTIWVFETSLYAFIVAAFFANGMALATGSHFRITLMGHFWPRAKKSLDIAALLVTLAFALTLIVATAQFVIYSWDNNIRSNSLLSVPEYLPELALPIGGLALAMQAIAQLLRGAMPGGPEETDEPGA
jgi:TRAP-type C4-dicarboxylate transport system permease small subunit